MDAALLNTPCKELSLITVQNSAGKNVNILNVPGERPIDAIKTYMDVLGESISTESINDAQITPYTNDLSPHMDDAINGLMLIFRQTKGLAANRPNVHLVGKQNDIQAEIAASTQEGQMQTSI